MKDPPTANELDKRTLENLAKLEEIKKSLEDMRILLGKAEDRLTVLEEGRKLPPHEPTSKRS